MNQSAVIVGALLAGFVLWIASRGRLGVYASVLWGPTPDAGSSAKPATAAGKAASTTAAGTIKSAQQASSGNLAGAAASVLGSIFSIGKAGIEAAVGAATQIAPYAAAAAE